MVNMDESTGAESVSLLKKLEFDKVARYAAGFCISEMGRDLVEQMEAPLAGETERELRRVLELKNFLFEGAPLPFSQLPDTRRLLDKLEVLESWLDPEELLDIAALLQSSAQLRRFMFSNRDIYPELNELTIALWLEKSIQYAVALAIDERGMVRDTASDALLEIRNGLSEARDGLRRKMERLLRRCQAEGWLMEETVGFRHGRQVLALRVENKYRLPGYIQDYSQSGQTVFVEPAETLEISNRIQELEIAERREIERILKDLSGQVRQELPNVRHNQEIMASFDTLYARARLAIQTGSMLPQLSAGRRLKIVKGYHPWLFISHGFSKEKVLPLDMELSENEQALVISGPNAGGKSVAMKTVGLLCCMLQHGYLVPCSESSEFSHFAGLFIEIGDEQSIENDLSTFSSHLAAIRDILDRAAPGSLVLIDELCSGTDVEEGSAIARAVIEELISRDVKTVVTTHLGELKVYAHRREGVVNGAMEFDRNGLAPTFRFLKGVPGNSFAFAMMRRMGFSDEIVNRASGFLTTGHTGLEEMIEDFRQSAAQNRELETELRRERLEAESIRSTLTLQRAELRKKMQELKSKGYRDLNRQLEQARKEIRDLVREVKEHPGDEATLHKARTRLAGMKQEAASQEEKIEREVAPQADLSIQPGDSVRIGDTNTTGEVESIQGDSAVVRCGNFRLTTALRGLEKISRAGAKKLQKEGSTPQASSKSWSVKSSSLESTRLDLRGLTGDEAIAEIGRFIDALAMHRMPSGTIVHGKGSGALRLRTAEFLKQHPRVKSFRLGSLQEGGAGVTVVEMR
ncbi:MAG: Smr/MutS family protein [Chlorobiaceae bacterium]|nr:Smr/MutS family protein [Chlorobiaceae bacterium]